VDSLCRELAVAASSASPDEMRTLTVPMRLKIEEVRVEQDAAGLSPEAWRDELAALPEGSSRLRQAAPGAISGTTYGFDESVAAVTASYTSDEIRQSATVRPAHFPARTLDAPAWVQRWTVSRTEQHLGASPSQIELDRFELAVAWLPIPPVGEESGDGIRTEPGNGPFEIRADPSALVAEVGRRVEDAAALTPEALEDAVTQRPEGLDSDGWMFVVCLPDGRARWGIPPTAARAEVLDPMPLCGAINARMRLGQAR
jgi:hypothetical protein